MARTSTRWLIAGAALAFAAITACPSSSADEAPPRPLRLRLDAGKTYLYRFSQSFIGRMNIDLPESRTLAFESHSDVVWDAGLTLQSVEANGDVIVSLLPTRVRGDVKDVRATPESFDSDDPKRAATSPFLGRGIRIRLSAEGCVLDAQTTGSAVSAESSSAPADSLTRLGPAPPRAFAQMFLQQLPAEAPRTGSSWNSTRALPLEWGLNRGKLRCTAFADASEKATVESGGSSSVSATVVARGKREVPKVKERVDTGGAPRLILAPMHEQVEEWFVTGDVRVRSGTGLVELRTTKCTIATRFPPFQLPEKGFTRSLDPEGPAEARALDMSYEITTRLELLDVR